MKSGPENPGRREALRKGLAIGAVAGLAAGAGLFMKTGKEETKKREEIPGESGIEKDKKVLESQIKVLGSFGDKDFQAISKGRNAQEREAEFVKLLDKRFNAAIETPPGIAQEAKGEILNWFHGLEAKKKNTTAEDLHEETVSESGRLENRLVSYDKGSSDIPPEKLDR
ncbi:MAG: hypothetical protein Q7S05_00470 [bacterium]|nr:hypothetical protein [bacterium]